MELGKDVIKVPTTYSERHDNIQMKGRIEKKYQVNSCSYYNIWELLTKLVPFYVWLVTII